MAALTEPGRWLYGIQLPIQTLTQTLADPWESSATVDDLVRVAQKAEGTGHSFVGVCDHIAIPDDDYAARMTTTWFDPVATLAYLAARTERVRLLSVVWVAAYRHPLQTAKAFATLDRLSGGRAVLGVGAGHVEGEFRALGIDYHRRGRILDEVLEAVRGAFSAPYVSFEGEHFEYERVGVGPAPVQRELPIWVGGSGRAAWRRTGRFADGYIPMGAQPDTYPEIIETIRESATTAGRSETHFDIGYMPGWAYLSGPAPDDLSPVMHTTSEALAADIAAALAAGANVMHLKFRARSLPEYLEQFDAFAENVVPLIPA